MKHPHKSLFLALTLCAPSVFAANAYQCPTSSPIDSLHNRSGWYVGAYTPQSGDYSGTIGSVETLVIKANDLIDTATSPHLWAQQVNGDGTARLATSSVNLSAPNVATVTGSLVGLNTVAPTWQNASGDTQWPAASPQGAMHGLVIQRNHLKSNANSARRSHALDFAEQYMEYRLVGSSDTTVDGFSSGQLTLGGELLDVEIITEYLAPSGWGDNDFCWRLFNNNNGYKGFEVLLRPVVYVLGQNLNLIANIPDIAGDYVGKIELAYDTISTSRPVY